MNGSAPTKVRIHDLKISYEAQTIRSIGRLESNKEAKLSFKIGGVIESMMADEGDYVSKGSVLAVLRKDEIDAQVIKAKRALEKAERDIGRVKEMYEDEAATLENVQDLTTLVEISKADLNIAEFNQKYASAKSPISGRVIRRLSEPNELIGPGQPILLVASSGSAGYNMTISVSDRSVARISEGDLAKLSFDAFPSSKVEGRVERIAEGADPRTGTFLVEISLNPTEKRLRAGMIGRVEVIPSFKDSIYKIPMESLVESDDDKVVVFVPDKTGEFAVKNLIEPLVIGNDHIKVKASQLSFNRVITDGASYLLDGDEIEIIE